MDEFTKVYEQRTSQVRMGKSHTRHMLSTVYEKQQDAKHGVRWTEGQMIASTAVAALSFYPRIKTSRPAVEAARSVVGVIAVIGGMAYWGTLSRWRSYETELWSLERRLNDLLGSWWNLENMIRGANGPAHLDYLTNWRMNHRIEDHLKQQAAFERSIATLERPRFSLLGWVEELIGH